MKKSLVITTIATILVIVVALTTATFAWFSSGDESNVTSSFTAQADNAAFSFSKWEGTDYAVTSSTTIDFTDAEGLYGTNPYAYWSTNGMKAVAPINEINLDTVDTFVGGEVAGGMAGTGLPGEAFYSAQAVAGNTSVNAIKYLDPKNLVYSSGTALEYPNIARFSMTNIKDYTQAVQATVTITPTDPQSSNDVRAASALRFVIIAQPLSGDPTGFVLASQYNYGIKNGGTDIFTDGGTVPSSQTATNATYTAVSTADEDGVKRIIAAKSLVGQSSAEYTLLAAGLPAESTEAATYGKAMMASGASYAIYMYVWLDGTTVGSSASTGSFTFTLSFTGQELTTTEP